MALNQIQLNNVGTEFRILILDNDNEIVNLSTASTMDVTLRKPSGVNTVGTGTLYTDGTDGIISYVLAAGDVDETGIYKIQAYIEIGANEYYSTIVAFTVLCNL